MYYGGSSEHPVLGLIARSPGHGPDEPLAASQMAAAVDAGGHARRRRRTMVCLGVGGSSLRRPATISRSARSVLGGEHWSRPVSRTETGLSPETPVCARTSLLGGIAAARSVLV